MASKRLHYEVQIEGSPVLTAWSLNRKTFAVVFRSLEHVWVGLGDGVSRRNEAKWALSCFDTRKEADDFADYRRKCIYGSPYWELHNSGNLNNEHLRGKPVWDVIEVVPICAKELAPTSKESKGGEPHTQEHEGTQETQEE